MLKGKILLSLLSVMFIISTAFGFEVGNKTDTSIFFTYGECVDCFKQTIPANGAVSCDPNSSGCSADYPIEEVRVWDNKADYDKKLPPKCQASFKQPINPGETGWVFVVTSPSPGKCEITRCRNC